MKRIILFTFILSLLMSSCGGSKKTVTKPHKPDTSKPKPPRRDTAVQPNNSNENLDVDVVKYVAKYRKVAKKEMKEYGIPSSITLAQGILESKSGKSELATQGNNHFGIKCHKDWHGKTIFHDDNVAHECFRKYQNPEDSYKDHSRFLAQRKRYAFLFRLPKTDYESWARGLKKAGYATDPSYPEKLIYIIEKYGLSKIDREVLENMSVKVTETDDNMGVNKKKKFIYEVKDGETIFSISHKFGIPVKDIQRVNNLNDLDIYEGQILVLTTNTNGATTETSSEPKPDEVETPVATDISETTETITTPETTETTTTPETTETTTTPEITTTPVITPSSDDSTTTPPTDTNIKLHEVKQGETLFSIAKTYHIDISDLRDANQLPNNEINIGDTIKIPLDKVKDAVETTTNPTETQVVKVETPVVTTPLDDGKEYHIVQPGETLYRIHINYKVSIAKLRKLNHLRGNYIKVGQKLRVK